MAGSEERVGGKREGDWASEERIGMALGRWPDWGKRTWETAWGLRFGEAIGCSGTGRRSGKPGLLVRFVPIGSRLPIKAVDKDDVTNRTEKPVLTGKTLRS